MKTLIFILGIIFLLWAISSKSNKKQAAKDPKKEGPPTKKKAHILVRCWKGFWGFVLSQKPANLLIFLFIFLAVCCFFEIMNNSMELGLRLKETTGYAQEAVSLKQEHIVVPNDEVWSPYFVYPKGVGVVVLQPDGPVEVEFFPQNGDPFTIHYFPGREVEFDSADLPITKARFRSQHDGRVVKVSW